MLGCSSLYLQAATGASLLGSRERDEEMRDEVLSNEGREGANETSRDVRERVWGCSSSSAKGARKRRVREAVGEQVVDRVRPLQATCAALCARRPMVWGGNGGSSAS